MEWDRIADDQTLENVKNIMEKNGIKVTIAESAEDAKKEVYDSIPEGSEIMEASSITLDEMGMVGELLESTKYKSLRKMMYSINDKAERDKYRKSVLAHQYAVGSAHAVTESGQIVVASASGSQIGSYAYGADHVILVIGAQKIVKDLDSAFRRINEYVFPLEDKRMHEKMGMGSVIAKTLIISKEIVPGRTKVIFVKQKLGF